jgi:hypothetical protein
MINTFLVSSLPKAYESNKIVEYYTAEEQEILNNLELTDSFPTEILDKNITLDFIEQGSILKFTLKQNNVIKYKFSLNLDTIKSSTLFADQTYWAIKSNSFLEKCVDLDNPYSLTLLDIVELSNITISTKTSYDSRNFPTKDFEDKDNTNSSPFKLFVPSVNSSLSDCKIIVMNPVPDTRGTTGQNSTIVSVTGDVNIVNLTPEITTTEQQVAHFNSTKNPHWDWRSLISNVSLSSTAQSYSAGDDIVVNVTTEDTTISKVYLDPVVGILNKQQVNLVNGAGSFVIKTDTLQSGDNVRVKVGYKYFTGAGTFTKTLA